MKFIDLKRKDKINLPIFILGVFILFVPLCNHTALFITEYYFLLLLFVFLGALYCRFKIALTSSTLCVFGLMLTLLVGTALYVEYLDLAILLSYLFWYAVLLIVYSITIKEKEVDFLINCYIICSVVFSILLLVFRKEYLWEGSFRYTVKIGDMVAFDPNYLSSFMLGGLAFSVYKIFFDHQKRGRKLYFIAALLILLAIFFTGSRSAYLSAIIVALGCFFQLWKSGRIKIKTIILILCVIIAVIVFFMMLPDEIKVRFNIESLDDESNAQRLEHWSSAIKTFKHSPLLGFGAAHTITLLANFAQHIGDAHNTYLTVLLQYGGVGFILFAVLVWKSFRAFFKRRDAFWVFYVLAFMVNNFIIANNIGISFWIPIILMNYIGKCGERYSCA